MARGRPLPGGRLSTGEAPHARPTASRASAPSEVAANEARRVGPASVARRSTPGAKPSQPSGSRAGTRNRAGEPGSKSRTSPAPRRRATSGAIASAAGAKESHRCGRARSASAKRMAATASHPATIERGLPAAADAARVDRSRAGTNRLPIASRLAARSLHLFGQSVVPGAISAESHLRESNSGPSDYKSDALPTELRWHLAGGRTGEGRKPAATLSPSSCSPPTVGRLRGRAGGPT